MVFALAGDSTTTSFNRSPSRIRVEVGTAGFALVKRSSRLTLSAGVAVEPAGEVELEQRHLHRAARRARTGG